METYVFIIVSFIVHVILFLSIFDIYFTSPIVHGMREFPQSINVPAKRLVLFVADGLRADKFYEIDENKQTRAPFLRKMILKEGSWGVSHPRKPIESRPCHVAMIAGFYEDFSAIKKNWKENPVEFDSVFNQSRNTWAFGNPDVVPVFAKGDSSARVHINVYDRSFEMYQADDYSYLDDWVFKQFSSFIESAKSNSTLVEELKKDKIIFFLHLVGTDTNGHRKSSSISRQYLSNIRKVDKIVEKVTKMLEQFYKNDRQTAYVFTADHGQTDSGSHGAGFPPEISVPLIVWGAGAKKHDEDPSLLSEEEEQKTRLWWLDPSLRRDVNQTDIAPLMAGLVGVPIPVNSVGVLPHNYISLNSRSKAKLMLTNMKQITEQFLIKRSFVKNTSFIFKSFSKLSPRQITDAERKVLEMISKERFDAAITECRRVIYLSLEGLQYYHTYHRVPLYIAVVFSFVGWIFYNLLLILSRINFIRTQAKKFTALTNQSDCTILFLFFVFGALMTAILVLLHLPWSYYFYLLLPLSIWYRITKMRFVLRAGIMILATNQRLVHVLASNCLLIIAGTRLLVSSFHYRYVLSVELLLFGIFGFQATVNRHTKVAWALLCLLLSIFPLLPVVGQNANYFFVIASGIIGSYISYFAMSALHSPFSSIIVLLPMISGCLVFISFAYSSLPAQIPFYIHACSWSLLVSSWFIPIFSSNRLIPRIVCIFTCYCASYILICLSYDALFFILFCGLLSVWSRFEFESWKNRLTETAMDFTKLPLTVDKHSQSLFDILRRSYFLLFFLILAFFGINNIPSINNFSGKIVYPFISGFKPFIKDGLLACKILLPCLLVACTLCCVAITTRTDSGQVFRFGLIICDIMAFHFFFMVKDTGSWSEIGESVSHYAISMTMATTLLFLYEIAKLLTSRSISLGVRKK